MLKKVVAFIDGENLVYRYQAMANDRVKRDEVVHIQDCFVWSPDVTQWTMMDLIRVSYYTSVVGDDDEVNRVSQRISQQSFTCKNNVYSGNAHIIPRVYKKPKKSNKTKIIDISLTMDIMRAALEMQVDGIYLLSGDADYIPLVHEITRITAKQVYVAAFSSGLANGLRYAAEHFVDLDPLFFVTP